MLKLIGFTLFYFFIWPLFGQNLIPNPGFEQCDKCDNRGFKELSIGFGANDPIDWNAATYGTPDFQSISPHSGKKHGGFFVGFPKFEYLTNHFTECLRPGAIYQFSFWISPDTRNPNYLIDEIGVHFQKGPASYLQTEPLKQLTPIFQSNDGDFIANSGYRKYSFIDTAHGGEDHFIVGRFRSLGLGDTTFIGSKRPANPAGEPIYYFVDDFEMIEISPGPIVDLIPAEIILCPGDHKQLTIPFPYDHDKIKWSTGDTTSSIDIPIADFVTVDIMLSDSCHKILHDSTHIIMDKTDTIKILSADSICLGDTILLNAPCKCFNYIWNTNETTPTIKVVKSGEYSVKAKTICKDLHTTKTIYPLNKAVKTFIEFPNVFVPNGEEKNRSFGPYIKADEENRVMNMHMSIFNRWGQRVYDSKDKSAKWSPDIDMPMDTYMYVCEIEYQDCNQIRKNSFKGTVTLIR